MLQIWCPMTQRILTDEELKRVSMEFCGLTLQDASDLMERELSLDVGTVMKAVAPFLTHGTDPDTVRAAIESLPRAERVEMNYQMKILTILNIADYGPHPN
jgi:hypothetical protein